MANAQQIGAELERFVERLLVKITLDMVANLTEATPVDSGWARALSGLEFRDRCSAKLERGPEKR